MAIKICDKRQSILDCQAHVLVTGGPGSGKTTIALLKALKRIETGLKEGQSVLFLSFSRAAVARIAEAVKGQIPKSHRHLLSMHTFHSFFWEILHTHSYLLGSPKQLSLLAPHDEKALSDGIDRSDSKWPQWEAERQRLFQEEGKIAFDLFAPATAELLSRSAIITRLIANRFPLIIVDEAQDTGPEQWECVKALAAHSQILCLADLDQQIFDFLPGVGPERIRQIEADLSPTHVDLGSENNRSPDSEIAIFGYDILAATSRHAPYKGVSHLSFNPKAQHRDRAIRQSLGMASQAVRKATGKSPESIAFLASFDKGAAIISAALREGKNPIHHKLLFDEAVTLLAGRFVAFLIEPKHSQNLARDLATALDLLSLVFRAKGTSGARTLSKKLLLWGNQTREGHKPPRDALYKKLNTLLNELLTAPFSGDPNQDWNMLRGMLRSSGDPELMKMDRDLHYLMAFNRGKRIASGLSSAWEERGNYSSARRILDAALAEDQILSGGEDLSGIHVMTMHKSKGKQFDAVIIFRARYSSPFAWPSDPRPYPRSRKILRVGITRARHHVLILNEAFPACPILGAHRLE